ncbi:MAG: phosphoglucosamine mutase [Halobacteriovoraceae bacterium]|nr:phosphoglucosamine mutase [Halobacteriovoraceae bacterium]
MGTRKLFGTDGIRGKANVFPMTGEVAFTLGRAVTEHFKSVKKNKTPLIIVGKDTRLSCYTIEQAFGAGVCAQGGRVILTGPLPTPGVAFVTKSMRADAGVMISASHNPYSDNGIKIFDADGFKLPDDVELKLESMVLDSSLIPTMVDEELGRAKRLEEVFGRYLVHCKSALDDNLDLEGMRIVLDSANGAAYKIAPMMFRELGAEVITLGDNPNGMNINLKCGSMHPEMTQEKVREYRADLGICLDGDADRLVVVDELGKIVPGDILIGCFAKLLLDQGVLKKGDTVVGTIMTNLGLQVYLESLGLKFHRTKVGDRYIIEHMKETSAIFGGEPSGHIIFNNNATTGDGSLAALKMIECMHYYNKSVSELTGSVKLFPQVLKNAMVNSKPTLDEIASLQSELAACEKELGDKGRIVLRYSGTESKLRVMVEGEKLDQVESICDRLLKIAVDSIAKIS